MELDNIVEDIVECIATRVAAKIDPQQQAPRLMSVKEVAAYLGRTEKAVRHLVASGDLPCVRVDSRVQFDRQKLDSWIAKHKEAL